MIALAFAALVLCGIMGWALKAGGVKLSWAISGALFLTIAVGVIVWLNWKIKHSPYP